MSAGAGVLRTAEGLAGTAKLLADVDVLNAGEPGPEAWQATNPSQTLAAMDDAALRPHLSIAYAPDPELLIRTGGESRISNFMLWQMAYTELFFTDTLWPDFSATVLDEALTWFSSRDRRFGASSAVLAR